ncbi:MAG: single-stranded-DNA-specific exonuclease RecJ [Mariprofundales bacterium]|nr:single-stranded-DNA-specific exonuclease RecJ [Mariprofundales bacterium]
MDKSSVISVRENRLAWRGDRPLIASLAAETYCDPSQVWQQIVRNRGLEDRPEWFTPQLAHLPDPSGMRDADRAAERLSVAIREQEMVHIFGDFDADGVNATAILIEGLEAAGLTVSWNVPHRSEQGHGIDLQQVAIQAAAGCKLGISCDTGISCVEAAASAKALGMDLIITDHHLPPAQLPDAFAILNPAREDCGFAGRKLCGCGVAFYLLLALWKRLRADGCVPNYDLKQLLDRVAVATIADMMELTGINRILVYHGLKRLGQVPSVGMAALLQLAGVADHEQPMVVKTVSFQIAPRINAASRMGHGEVAVRLLINRSTEEAMAMAKTLDGLNKERRVVEAATTKQAASRMQSGAVLAAFDPDWHPGVVGLAAGKLARRFHQPAAIGYLGEDGNIHLSLRGVTGFHIARLLDTCSPLLLRHGGHAGAGGCALPQKNWGKFLSAFANAISAQLATGAIQSPAMEIDAALTMAATHAGLADRIARFAPNGKGNPPCRLLLMESEIVSVKVVRGGALSIKLRDHTAFISAIAFHPGPLVELLVVGAKLALIGELQRDQWRGGDAVQLVIEDAWIG